VTRAGRFDRQIRFARLGREGQQRIQAARVLLVGAGALGGVIAQTLVRAGIGLLRLVDRDVVEESNLPRQVLFEDRHARASTPKAEAARESLERIGGPARIEAHIEHLCADNLDALARDVDLILDGTDNLGTRYLVNDHSIEKGVPWIYGGVVGGSGLLLAVLPGRGPCMRCLFPEPPPPGSLETCDTAGVILPAVGAVASMQSGLALRLLADPEGFEAQLIELDAWNGSSRSLQIARDENCPCCALGERRFLDAEHAEPAVVLCGRNAVQVRGRGALADLERLEREIGRVAREVERRGPLLRFSVEDLRVTLFPGGRALFEGTQEIERALALYDRYVGT
jgi:adenylyltransferase/sulfurtransferase